MKLKKTILFIMALCCVLFVTSCSKESATNSKFVGTWMRGDYDGFFTEWVLSKGGSMIYRQTSGSIGPHGEKDKLKETKISGTWHYKGDGDNGILTTETDHVTSYIVISVSDKFLELAYVYDGEVVSYKKVK